MIISPILLALLGLLLSALGAVVAGAIAWGRFAAALDRLREDHRETRDEVKKLVGEVTGVALAKQRLDALEAEVSKQRDARHAQASAITRIEAELAAVRTTAERARDEARASHHPH